MNLPLGDGTSHSAFMVISGIVAYWVYHMNRGIGASIYSWDSIGSSDPYKKRKPIKQLVFHEMRNLK
jgi:hypothetical protein